MDSSSSIIAAHFLANLAERKYRENDLSDVTWALCQAAPEFARAFADFIGIETAESSGIRVEREFNLGEGCRVDMACRANSTTVFIEVKIYDQNYHLEQYTKRIAGIPDSRLVLLTNHAIPAEQSANAERLGWRVLCWDDFVAHVERRLPQQEPLIHAYLQYVRRVCNMIQLREIRFDAASLYSLASFHALAEEAIGSASHDAFVYSRYKSPRDHGPEWSGACFELRYQAGDILRQAWGFFGLGFEVPGIVELMVWLDRDWNADVIKGVPVGANQAGHIASLNADGLKVVATEEELDHFLNLPLTEQREMLKILLRRLSRPIESHMSGTDGIAD